MNVQFLFIYLCFYWIVYLYNLDKIKLIKQMMEHLDVNELSIYSFEPHKIIMKHKSTKILYQYFQTSVLSLKQNNIFHNTLLSAIIIPTGLLYKKSITSLQIEISKRLQMEDKKDSYFQQEQILNTFLPILECLEYLNTKNICHRNVTMDSIQFNQEGEVMLKDWLLEVHNNPYYQNQIIKERQQDEDIIALGKIILQVTSLTKFKDMKNNDARIQKALKIVIDRYSKGIIIGIIVLIRKMKKYFSNLNKILSNAEDFIEKNFELVNIYRKLKYSDKQSKQVFSNLSLSNGLNLNKNTQILSIANNTLNYGSVKSPILVKKQQKIQDSQNKKHFTHQTPQNQKKNHQRIHKVSQKNICFQVAKKQDMALKKMSNYKLNFNVDKQIIEKSFKKNQKDKEQMIKYASPIKRLRTIPKKKNS